jgi:hypothetical protein
VLVQRDGLQIHWLVITCNVHVMYMLVQFAHQDCLKGIP